MQASYRELIEEISFHSQEGKIEKFRDADKEDSSAFVDEISLRIAIMC